MRGRPTQQVIIHQPGGCLEFRERLVHIADVRQDARFLRPAEVDHLVGNASKARENLGWEPKVSFPSLVSRMVHADIDIEKSKRV